MLTEKVVIVNWSRISERFKLVHPIGADIAAIGVVFSCHTRPTIMQAFLLPDSHYTTVKKIHMFIQMKEKSRSKNSDITPN